MALENITGSNIRRRWMITFGFGLVHGFGFSFALQQTLQFAGSHLLTSLLSFNVGVELAVAERMGTIILSAIVAHTGWHWMIERGERLGQFQFQWPTVNAALLATVMRWLMVIVVLVAVIWLVSTVLVQRVRTGKVSN